MNHLKTYNHKFRHSITERQDKDGSRRWQIERRFASLVEELLEGEEFAESLS